MREGCSWNGELGCKFVSPVIQQVSSLSTIDVNALGSRSVTGLIWSCGRNRGTEAAWTMTTCTFLNCVQSELLTTHV